MDALVALIFGFVLATFFAVAGALVSSLPVMWLWNAVMPAIFGVRSLTWLQALWLCLLCSLLVRTGFSTRDTEK